MRTPNQNVREKIVKFLGDQLYLSICLRDLQIRPDRKKLIPAQKATPFATVNARIVPAFR